MYMHMCTCVCVFFVDVYICTQHDTCMLVRMHTDKHTHTQSACRYFALGSSVYTHAYSKSKIHDT